MLNFTFHEKMAFCAAVALLLLISACDHIPALRGSGNLISETRRVSDFEEVEFDNVGNVDMIQDGTESITIETDDDVMKYVTTKIHDGTLYVKRDLIGPTPTKLNVTLHVKELTGISIPGTWDVRSESLEVDRLGIKIDGTGTVRIKLLTADDLAVVVGGVGLLEIAGQVPNQTILVSGKTVTYRAGDLQSKTSTIAGTGEFTLWVTEALNMKIDGSCIMEYYGSPVVRIGKSNSCEIRNLGEK